MKLHFSSLLLLLTCCIASQAWAQRHPRPRGTWEPFVCHIGSVGFASLPYTNSAEITLPCTGQAELLNRTTHWARSIKIAEAPAIQFIPDTLASTTTVETAGTWPLTYTLNGKRTTIPLHFTALITPSSDSSYSYEFSRFTLLVPGSPVSAEYIMQSKYSHKLPKSLRDALHNGFRDARESLYAELLVAMSHPLAKTTKAP